MRLPNRRTLFALMAGLCVGLLISPLPTLLVVPESSCGAKRSPDEAMRGGGRTGNGRHATAEEETTISLEKIPNRLDFNWSQLSKQEVGLPVYALIMRCVQNKVCGALPFSGTCTCVSACKKPKS